MTKDEFNTFQRQLFAAFPGTHAWLAANSPDMGETLRSWFRRLERFTAAECQRVLEIWEASNVEPFKAYDRENVPAIIASVIDKERDKVRKQQEVDEWRERHEHYAQARRGAPTDVPFSGFDGSMTEAMQELIPHHKRMIAGEITMAEYAEKKRQVLDKL